MDTVWVADDLADQLATTSLIQETEKVTPSKVEKTILISKIPDEFVEPIPSNLKRMEYLECPSNWIQFLRCGVHVGSPSTQKYILDWVEVHDKKVTYAVRNSPIEYFVKKILQALLKSNQGDEGPKEAFVILDKLVKLIIELDEARFSSAYKEGLMNLIACTRQEIKRHYGFRSSCQFTTPEPKKLEELSDAARCPVLAAKVWFIKIVKGSLAYQERLVKQILAYEKDRAEWWHLFYSVLRAIRHQDAVRFRFRPDAFELNSLGKAYTLDKDNMEILVSIWKTLFDCHKQRRDFFVEIGSLQFYSREAIGEYLCTSVLQIVAEEKDAMAERKDYSVRALLAAAQIIGDHRMPELKRNLDLAETLMEKALLEWPTFSKILSRMGTFKMMEKKNMEGAKAMFLQAITEDPSDAVSALNYFWIDSSKQKVENIQKIDEMMASVSACQWPDHVRLDLEFLQGCIYFSMRNAKLALAKWTHAQEISYTYFMTKLYTIASFLRKFYWKIKKEEDEEERMTVEFIEKIVEDFAVEVSSEEVEDKGFFKLVEILKTIQKARARPLRENVEQEEALGIKHPRRNAEDRDGNRPPRESQGGDNWRGPRNDRDGARPSRDDQDGEGNRGRRNNWNGEKKPSRDYDNAATPRRDNQNEGGTRAPRNEWNGEKKPNRDYGDRGDQNRGNRASRGDGDNRNWKKSGEDNASKRDNLASGANESDWRSRVTGSEKKSGDTAAEVKDNLEKPTMDDGEWC